MISTILPGVLALARKGFTMSDSGMGVPYNQLLRRALVLLTITRKESSECSGVVPICKSIKNFTVFDENGADFHA